MDFISVGSIWCVAFTVVTVILGALNYYLCHHDGKQVFNKNTFSLNKMNKFNSINHCENGHRKVSLKSKRNQKNTLTPKNTNNVIPIEHEQSSHVIKSVVSQVKSNNQSKEEKSNICAAETNDQLVSVDDDRSANMSTVLLPILSEHEQRTISTMQQCRKDKIDFDEISSFNPVNGSLEQISPSTDELDSSFKHQISATSIQHCSSINSNLDVDKTNVLEVKSFESKVKRSSNTRNNSYNKNRILPPRFQTSAYLARKTYRLKLTKQSSPLVDIDIEPHEFTSSNVILKINKHSQPETRNQNESLRELELSPELISTGIESENKVDNSNMNNSIGTSKRYVDDINLKPDDTSFSFDDLIGTLKTIFANQFTNKQDYQRLLSAIKADKTIQHFINDKYHNQVKYLSSELQMEKYRIAELTKTNAELNQTIYQLQHANSQICVYHETLVSYQTHLRRFADENAHLIHALRTYSMMPIVIDGLTRQQFVLNQQLAHLANRNNVLEKEMIMKHCVSQQNGDLYSEANIHDKEQIEQLINEINKYKSDLNSLQEEYNKIEENFQIKLNDITHQRDQLQISYDRLSAEYDQSKPDTNNQCQNEAIDQLKQELSNVKAKNDFLTKRYSKIIEQLTQFSNEDQIHI